jgi:hypothetical protein
LHFEELNNPTSLLPKKPVLPGIKYLFT